MKRNLSRMFRTGVAAAAALLCAMPFQAAAEDYPSRPITLIMPFGAGNAPDTAARIIGDYLQRKHNITLLITSKPGGSGIPATLETVRARPDGYTISLTSANVLTVVPQYKKCGFTYKDLAPVAQVNVFTMGWGVRADSGIASVQDLMDKAKAERGKYSLASPGAFTAQRFYHANVMKLFPESDLPYVAYNGGAEIVTALLGNHISAGFTPVVNFKPHKDIRVIAVCGAQRDPNYPDAPTFKEMFGDGFVFDSVYGIVAPLKTPKDRIERLQSLIKEALSDPDVQAKFAKVNMTTNYLPADEFGKVIEGYYKLFEEPIRKAKDPFCTGLAGVEGEYNQGNDGGIQKDKDQPQIYFLCRCFDHNVFASPSLSVITEITILKIMNSISTMESPLPRFQLPVWVNSCSMTLPMSRILLPPKILLITKVVRAGTNTIVIPLNMPGRLKGKMIRTKVCTPLAPRS